jgi:hypothetical protein
MAEATVTTTDFGHFRTREEDEKQAEDRQSRPSADIRITFLEAIAGEKLPQWQRDIVEKLVTAPKMLPLPRYRMRLPPPPPSFFRAGDPPGNESKI